MITKLLSYHPMPVCTKAITPTIPNAKNKPGEGSEGYRYQVQFPCFFENPACHIKQCKCRVKYKEENIEELVKHH